MSHPTAADHPGYPSGGDDAGPRYRLHPLTPLAHAAQVVPVALAAVVFAGAMSVATRLLVGAVVAATLGSLIAVVTYLQWTRFTYYFDDAGDLCVDSGILQRNHKTLQLSRLQAVEVNQPFWARLFGLAELTAEVAGAGGSRVQLRYLDVGTANHLRNDLLGRAAGIGSTTAEAPETVIARVPPAELLFSLLIRAQTLGLLILSGLLLAYAFSTGGVGALGFAVLTGGVPLFGIVGEFLRSYGFTVALSPDGLRIRRGLTTTVSNTVPPGRVHAVGFVAGPIWRRLGWVRVLVDLGGSPGSGDDHEQGSTVLLPVASWSVALEVVSHLLPGVDLAAIGLDPAPPRTKWRAPLQRDAIGVGMTEEVLVARRGWLNRWFTVVPHTRVQSVHLSRGPWQRPLDLATFHIDTVPGPVSVHAPHIDATRAREYMDTELELARVARRSDDPQRWMTRRSHHFGGPGGTGDHGPVDGR